MNKHREMFLSKNFYLKRFTKEIVMKNCGLSEEAFNQLLKEGFIQEDPEETCESCLRTWKQTQFNECVKVPGLYSYK